jgi:O-antigen ligase
MNKKKIILDYSAFLFAIALPISTKLGNIALGLFLFFAIFNINDSGSSSNTKKSILWYSSAVFFVAYFIGFIISGDLSVGLNQFGKKVFYLLTPFVLCFLSKNKLESVLEYSLKGLVIGCILCSVFLITNNFYQYYLTRPLFYIDKSIFNFYYTGYNFTKILDIHPTYLGSYFVLALAYSLNAIFKKINITNAICIFIITSLYLITILFINARIIYITTFIVIIFFLIQFGYVLLKRRKNKLFISLISIFILLLLGGSAILKNTFIAQRVSKELVWELSSKPGTEYSFDLKGDSRLSRWQAAISVIKKNPLSGYGLHTEKDVLVNEYDTRGMIHSVKFRYDAHNQFLSFFIQFGLAGLVLFFYFISNFSFAISSQKSIYIIFCVMILSICLVENYLNMNAGILFVAYFGNLFMILYKKESTSNF